MTKIRIHIAAMMLIASCNSKGKNTPKHETTNTPADFSGAVWCVSPRYAFLAGTTRGAAGSSSGIGRATIVRVTTDGRVEEKKLPGEFVISLDRAREGTITAVVSSATNQLEGPRLWRSLDDGDSWLPMSGAPPDISGTVFVDRMTGYAWSNDRVYHTGDAGVTWQKSERFSATIARGNADERPTLASDGSLWVIAVDRPGDSQRQVRLVRVDSSTATRELTSWAGWFVAGMMHGPDRSWILMSKAGGSESRLEEIRHESTTETTVIKSWPRTEVQRFRGSADHLAFFALGSRGDQDGPAGPWTRKLFASNDRGRTWLEQDLNAERVDSFAFGEGKTLWVHSRPNHVLTTVDLP